MNKISFPRANYGIAKNLSAEKFTAITRHELAHIDFSKSSPRATLWAGSKTGTPGQGLARFRLEFHGNMAEHNGNIGKAFCGALLKDTPWEEMVIDSVYLMAAGVGGYFAWQWLKK